MLEHPPNLGNSLVGSEVNDKSRGEQSVVVPIQCLPNSEATRTFGSDAQIGVPENLPNLVHVHPSPQQASAEDLLKRVRTREIVQTVEKLWTCKAQRKFGR